MATSSTMAVYSRSALVLSTMATSSTMARALLLAAALATTSALSSSISAKDRVRPPPSRSEDGFPAVFDRGAFEAYLDTRPGTVAKRAAAFAAEAGPLQLRAASLWASGQLRRDDAAFAASVRGALERLGPAFVKIGQLLSVREVLMELDELAGRQVVRRAQRGERYDPQTGLLLPAAPRGVPGGIQTHAARAAMEGTGGWRLA